MEMKRVIKYSLRPIQDDDILEWHEILESVVGGIK